MEDFFAYFHVEETNSIYSSLGHIHDSFVRDLPADNKVYVGWDTSEEQRVRYRVKIECDLMDPKKIVSAFRSIINSFDPHIRLGILLSKPYRGRFVLLDLIES